MSNDGMGRRRFLKNSALGVAGAGLLANAGNLVAEETKQIEPLKIKKFRQLGRTGFMVSDIASGFTNNAAVLRAALEAGVNYIDTAESYRNQPVVGEAIQGFDRKKLFITSKLVVKEDISKEEVLKRTRKCLEELKTDYLDCMMIHSCENRKLVGTKGFHDAMKQLKTEGKVRYVGISNHGSNWARDGEESMAKVLLAAAADGRFDVMLMAYNFLQTDQGADVLKVCKEKNIGATLMKVNPVGQYYGTKERVEKMRKEGKTVSPRYLTALERYKKRAEMADDFIKKYDLKNPVEIRNAAIRFALDNQDVNTVCCAFNNFDDLDAFIPLSGTTLSGMEKKKLAAYKEGCGSLYCRHACGICESSCPKQVPVNTIMRYNHYYEAHGRQKYALKRYAILDAPKADLCQDCDGHCEIACPYGVPTQGMMVMAHQRLTLV